MAINTLVKYKEEYINSAKRSLINLPSDFDKNCVFKTSKKPPKAIYCVIVPNEADYVRLNGLYLPEINMRSSETGLGRWDFDDEKRMQYAVFTKERVYRRDGLMRIKISFRHTSELLDNYDPCFEFRTIKLTEQGFIICNPMHIYPEQCYFLDPYLVNDSSLCSMKDLWNSKSLAHGGRVWDNVCHIRIGENIENLNDLACCGAQNLETVNLGDKVRYIGTDSFSSCPKLHSVYIGKSVTDNAGRAFNNCRSLKYVLVHASLKEKFHEVGSGKWSGFGSWFADCPNLFSIKFTDGSSFSL